MFEEGALNTFDAALARQRQDAGRLLVAEHTVSTRPLRDILDAHSPRPLDFLNVDAEGCDLEVLQSNDWDKYRPRLVCVEALRGDDDPANGWLRV